MSSSHDANFMSDIDTARTPQYENSVFVVVSLPVR
jgi:hypothetical protein